MKKIYYPILALSFALASCTSEPKTLNAGIKLENLDTTAVPGNDFFQYACGGWMKNNPLTEEYARYGSFDKLRTNNTERLRDLIGGIAGQQNPEGSEARKIGDLYNIAMDSTRLNNEGCSPIKADLERIAAIKNSSEIAALMGDMDFVNMFFAFYVDADIKDASKNLFQIVQAGIGMGNRDYYLDETETMTTVRNAYVEHVKKMFVLAGFSEEEAAKAVGSVMNIENRLAKAHFTQVALRNPEGNYNKYTLDELKTEYSGFDWDAFFSAINADVKELSICQAAPVKEAIAIMNDTKLEDLKYYMQWHLIDAAASYLSDDMFTQNFNFYDKVMSGKMEPAPRWKRAVNNVDNALGMAVGKLYCEKYFTAEAKTRMEALVQNLLTAYGQRMDNLTWMSDETKAKAHEKLSTFYVKVGYPKEWLDYSSLEINPEDSYWTNLKRVNRFNTAEAIKKLGKPVDKDEWLMTPQTVNAYYNPTTNEICFPAGILQYPFFDMSADDAFNYGAIGVVIAHEVTHGFDDQGSQFDKDGNLANWWTDEDRTNFEARTKVMEEYFNGIEVAPGLFANGAFTLGENIADHGGIQVAYQAFQNAQKENPLTDKDGFTPEQRFFIAYANLWAGNIRPEEIVRLTKIDPHSLGRWRVNGALPHISAWYDAFGITEDNALYLAPEKRVSIW